MKAEFVSNFRDLEVYQHAFAASMEVHRISEHFPKHELYSLADQWKRTARGISANIAEGYAKQRFSKSEFKRFLGIAIGCCIESQVWADYAKALEYIDAAQHRTMLDTYERIEKMLHKLHQNVRES